MPKPSSEKITSLQNSRIKAVRALEMRKTRRQTGQFVAEGASLLIAGREQDYAPETLVYLADTDHSDVVSDYIAWAASVGADTIPASHAVLAKLSGKDNPQTLLGVFRQRWVSLPDLSEMRAEEVWLGLEEVRDPGNLGTIIRTVDAVGAAGIILIGQCCDPFSRDCVRATMGSIFSVPLAKCEPPDFRDWCVSFPGDVVGTHLTGKEDFRMVDYRLPTLLLMGSEGPGLSDTLVSKCSRLVKIPMAGKLDSLNLAVATALTLYQIRGAKLEL